MSLVVGVTVADENARRAVRRPAWLLGRLVAEALS